MKSATTVLRFDCSTGISLDSLKQAIAPHLQAKEIIPLYIGSKCKSFIQGLIYINSIHDLDSFLSAPLFIGQSTKLTFKTATKDDVEEVRMKANSKVFVTICAPKIEQWQIKNYFAQFGGVQYVKLVALKPSHPDKRIAEVKMENLECVKRILACTKHNISGIVLHCRKFKDASRDSHPESSTLAGKPSPPSNPNRRQQGKKTQVAQASNHEVHQLCSNIEGVSNCREVTPFPFLLRTKPVFQDPNLRFRVRGPNGFVTLLQDSRSGWDSLETFSCSGKGKWTNKVPGLKSAGFEVENYGSVCEGIKKPDKYQEIKSRHRCAESQISKDTGPRHYRLFLDNVLGSEPLNN